MKKYTNTHFKNLASENTISINVSSKTMTKMTFILENLEKYGFKMTVEEWVKKSIEDSNDWTEFFGIDALIEGILIDWENDYNK